MSDTALQKIQALQRTDIAAANRQLLKFLHEDLTLPFAVESIELRPSAVSLNSINGVMQTSAGEKFFKTHIEPSSIIAEYYNAQLLDEAGYPVIRPIFASTDYGKQFLIYDYFDASSVFDMLRSIEVGQRQDSADLLAAMQTSDDLLAELYAESLTTVDAAEHADQPVHQLFLHRLTGPRLKEFYGGEFTLPAHDLAFADLAAKQWIVNGTTYAGTLQNIIDTATSSLQFASQTHIAAIAGHGDAHAGNLFYFAPDRPLTYFDPAFAGRHSPLLDVIKPWVHNSWLKWLYFPDEVAMESKIVYAVDGASISVTYDFEPSELRRHLFASKLDRVVTPTLRLMERKSIKPENWQAVIQAAAMCCPLLTMNLSNRVKFKPEIGLLGLALAVEFGGQSQNSAQPGWFENSLRNTA